MPKSAAQVVLAENKETAPTAIKTFVPYKSVLTFMSPPAQAPKQADEGTSYEKKKSKPAKFPKAGKVVNPMSKQFTTKGKSAMKVEIQAKKQKAVLARKKAQARVVTTIELEDSDESDCIPIELPPPPTISVDSSDDELAIQKRAMSPSTSSIMSDDFINTGDKRRLQNAFKSNDEVHERYEKNIAQLKENLVKAKAIIKPSSSSSSDSTRSSCERNVKQNITTETPQDQRKKRKNVSADRSSFDKTNEDSIYGAKASSKTQKPTTAIQSDSSEEESPCVNVRIQNVRRRKSTGSRKKSSEGDHSEPEDPRAKLIASTPIAQASKRSRFITPSYDDDEFASMISTIVQSAINDESEDGSNEAVIDAKTAMKKALESTVISVPDETIKETTVVNVPSRASEGDCEIIEQPTVVIEVPDEEVPSDSDDSLRGITLPDDCDLSLNVTQTPYNPHEYIRNAGETSQEWSSIRLGTVADPEIGWNDEMKFFYDGSWGDENFSISSIMTAMPRDPKLWKVIGLDRHRTADNTCRLRCKKCNELGHIAVKCNRPKKKLVCFMCGEEGHRETRCPNSICLRVSFGRFPSENEIYFYFLVVRKAESNVFNRLFVLSQAE